jgi:hypothetical protein
MHVYFFIAGRASKPSDFESEWVKEEDKAIVRRIRATLEEKAADLKCGTHGEEITAIISGPG